MMEYVIYLTLLNVMHLQLFDAIVSTKELLYHLITIGKMMSFPATSIQSSSSQFKPEQVKQSVIQLSLLQSWKCVIKYDVQWFFTSYTYNIHELASCSNSSQFTSNSNKLEDNSFGSETVCMLFIVLSKLFRSKWKWRKCSTRIQREYKTTWTTSGKA